MALLHPDIDSPPRYSRVRRPAGTFGRAFRSLKAARISPQNIGRIVCSRLTRSFPPLRLLFFIRASFFPPSLDFLHHLEKPWLELERKREKIHDNVFLFFSFLFFFFSSSEGSEWFTLCLLPRQWRKGETIVRKVNSLITSEIGIDGADYHGGQRDREVAPFVRSSPPFNTFSTAIRSPIRGCRCCNIQWAAVNNRFQCVHGNKPLPPSPFFFFFFFFFPFQIEETGKIIRIQGRKFFLKDCYPPPMNVFEFLPIESIRGRRLSGLRLSRLPGFSLDVVNAL